MYAVNEHSDTPIFQINQHIGDDKDVIDESGNIIEEGEGQGIDGIIFANEVLSYNDKSNIKELQFFVNCQGGDVQKSLDMFTAISRSNQKTYSIITGFAFSCGGWIPLAADKVDMVQETGRWMCHMPFSKENPEENSQFANEAFDIISKTIASKSGRGGVPKKTQDEIKKLMLEKTFWDAERMKKEGLIDNIISSSGKVVRMEKDPIMLNKSELNFYYKEYQSAQNKLIINKNNKIMPFPKLVNRLNNISKDKTGLSFNLTDDSSEDVIIDAISRIENKLRIVNEDMSDKDKTIIENKTEMDNQKLEIENKMKELELKGKEMEKATNSYNEVKLSYDKLEAENLVLKNNEALLNKEKLDADNVFKTERAKNYIDKLAEQNKIKANEFMTLDEIKGHLTKKAISNYEDVVLQYPLDQTKIKGPTVFKFKNGADLDVSLIEKLKTSNIERIREKQVSISNGVTRKLYDNSLIQ